MPWFKVDDRMTAHPAALRVGDAALGYWMRLGCWLAKFPEQAGFIPEHVALHLDGGSRRHSAKIKRLTEAGMLTPCDGGYLMHRTLDMAGSGLADPAWDIDGGQERRAHISRAVRASVYERDEYRCVECASTDDLSLDHIWPWSKGGSDELENLRTLCRPCNSRKGARV